MNEEQKCLLIEEFVREYGQYEFAFQNEQFLKFKAYNDLGIPLAQAHSYNMITLTDYGKEVIEETWQSMCEMLEVDPDGEYESIYNMKQDDDSE